MKLKTIVLSMAVLASPFIYGGEIDPDYRDMGYVEVGTTNGYISKGQITTVGSDNGKPSFGYGDGYIPLDKYLVRVEASDDSKKPGMQIKVMDRNTETLKKILIDFENYGIIKQVGESPMYTVLQTYNSKSNEEVYKLVVISTANEVYTTTINLNDAFTKGKDLALGEFVKSKGFGGGDYQAFAVGRIPALASPGPDNSGLKVDVKDFALIIGLGPDQKTIAYYVLNADGVISDQNLIVSSSREGNVINFLDDTYGDTTHLKRAAFTTWIDEGGYPTVGLSLTLHAYNTDTHGFRYYDTAHIAFPSWYIGHDSDDHYKLGERNMDYYGADIGYYDINSNDSNYYPTLFLASHWVQKVKTEANGDKTSSGYLDQDISIFPSTQTPGLDVWPWRTLWTSENQGFGRLSFDWLKDEKDQVITDKVYTAKDIDDVNKVDNCVVQGLVIGTPPSFSENNGKVDINIGDGQTWYNGREETNSEGVGISIGGLTANFSGQLEVNTSFSQAIGVSDSITKSNMTDSIINTDNTGTVFCLNPTINIRYGKLTDSNGRDIRYKTFGDSLEDSGSFITTVASYDEDNTTLAEYNFNTSDDNKGDAEKLMGGAQKWKTTISGDDDHGYIAKLNTLKKLYEDGVISEIWKQDFTMMSDGLQTGAFSFAEDHTESSKNTIKIEEKLKLGIEDVFNANESYSHEWVTSESLSHDDSGKWSSSYLGGDNQSNHIKVTPILYRVDIAKIKANNPKYFNDDTRHEELWFVSDYMWAHNSSFWLYAYNVSQ